MDQNEKTLKAVRVFLGLLVLTMMSPVLVGAGFVIGVLALHVIGVGR